jgi:hypothetical protein
MIGHVGWVVDGGRGEFDRGGGREGEGTERVVDFLVDFRFLGIT